MERSPSYYKDLLSRFIGNSLSVEQVEELYGFIEQEPEVYERLMNEPEIMDLVRETAANATEELRPVADERVRRYLQAYAEQAGPEGKRDGGRVKSGIKSVSKTRWISRRWAAAAAAVLLVLVTAVFTFHGLRDRRAKSSIAEHAVRTDVSAPQVTRATITLANGRRVPVDSLSSGLLAQQGGVRVVKMNDGRIAYEAQSAAAGKETAYNTLSNPKGSKVIDIGLSDGSHVWLNAGSSMTYPIVFSATKRNVQISGEAYFEVAADVRRPFSVTKANVVINVLGTHFNVNAYDDDNDVKITLLQGAIRVSNRAAGVVLAPGEQAAIVNTENGSGSISLVPHPDLEAVTAWKDGLFNFNRVPLQEVMRQLSRWYDVEVEYQGQTPTKMLGGEMQRDLSLSEVLDGLGDIGVHSRIEGKKLIILP